jgi:hypothetical protein
MKKNKLYILSSILIIISLFTTAAACNLCGVPVEIGEATTEETATGQQTTRTTQGQSQSTEAPAEGNHPPAIREIEFMGMDVEFIESEGGFDEIPAVVGEEATLTIEAYDEDNDELTYAAYDSLGTSFDVTKIDNNNAEFTWLTPGVPGSYTLTVEVSDGKGGADSYSIDMNFFALECFELDDELPEDDGAVDFGEAVNNPPEITRGILIENLPGVDSPEGGPYIAGGVYYRVSIEAHDPDGDPLIYGWGGGGSNGFSDTTANPTEWITPDIANRYTLYVHVSDGKGGEDSITLDVRVE